MAILVACLGLIGLVAFMGERRAREIGIRKVLGATTGSILGLLTTEFAAIVAVANLIVCPLSYILIERWLEGYPYRIEPGPGLFLVTAAVTLAIAAASVGWQAVRRAGMDPVEVLRAE